MTEQQITFREMYEKFNVTPRTLRYYEYLELIQPTRVGRSRFYGSKECARMTLILRGKRFGFSLEEIRQWLLIYEHEGTEAQMRIWVDMAKRQIKELAVQKEQLEETLNELQSLREQVVAELDNISQKRAAK